MANSINSVYFRISTTECINYSIHRYKVFYGPLKAWLGNGKWPFATVFYGGE